MKKKPIYLYVLLVLSAIGTLLGVWSRFFSKFSEVDYTQIGLINFILNFFAME